MKFWQAITWTEPQQLPGIARHDEEAGFDGPMPGSHGAFPRDECSRHLRSADGKSDIATFGRLDESGTCTGLSDPFKYNLERSMPERKKRHMDRFAENILSHCR